MEGVYSRYLPLSLSCSKIRHLTQAWPDTPDSDFESRASDPKKQWSRRILSGGSGKASLDFHEGGANAGSRVQCPRSPSSRDSHLGSSGGSNRNPSGQGLQWDFGHVSDCTLSPVPTHLGGLARQPSSQLVRSNGLIFKSIRVNICYLQIKSHIETNLDQAESLVFRKGKGNTYFLSTY